MRAWPFMLLVVLALSTGCADEARTSADGEPCPEVGEYGCFDNVAHLCRFDGGEQFWEPTEDCGGSSVSDCKCVVLSGQIGRCSVGGVDSTSAVCQGSYF